MNSAISQFYEVEINNHELLPLSWRESRENFRQEWRAELEMVPQALNNFWPALFGEQPLNFFVSQWFDSSFQSTPVLSLREMVLTASRENRDRRILGKAAATARRNSSRDAGVVHQLVDGYPSDFGWCRTVGVSRSRDFTTCDFCADVSMLNPLENVFPPGLIAVGCAFRPYSDRLPAGARSPAGVLVNAAPQPNALLITFGYDPRGSALPGEFIGRVSKCGKRSSGVAHSAAEP